MSAESHGGNATRKSWRQALRLSRLPIASLSATVLLPVLVVELAAVLVLAGQSVGSPLPTGSQVWIGTILLVLGLLHAEVSLRVERVRRRVTDALHVDLTSVWIFAGVLVLPSSESALLAVLLQVHLWRRAWRPRVPLYREIFTAATYVLACIASSAVLQLIPFDGRIDGNLDLLAIALALLVFAVVNGGLIAGVIVVSSPGWDFAAALGRWDENMLELATLSLGALTAAVLGIQPLLVLFVLPPLLVLHRAVLVRQLQEAADTDGKTGLLNAATWHVRAQNALASSNGSRRRAVLVLDLDHFKSVNDAHGHIAGDHVLAAVAAALRAEVRERDLVGRFGGEEFVVLLTGWDGASVTDLVAVAERIRARVARLQVQVPTPDGPLSIGGVSVSVGGAVHPVDGADLGALLHVADAALYAAKRAGRNAVRMGRVEPSERIPSPRVSGDHQHDR